MEHDSQTGALMEEEIQEKESIKFSLKRYSPKDLYDAGGKFYTLLDQYSKLIKKKPFIFGAKKHFEKKRETLDILDKRAEEERDYLQRCFAFKSSELYQELDKAYESLGYLIKSQYTACTMFLIGGTYRPGNDPFYFSEVLSLSETLKMLDAVWKEYCKQNGFKL